MTAMLSLISDLRLKKKSVPFDANLAEYMGEDYRYGSDLIAAYDGGPASRGEWEDAYIEGLDLLGVKIEDKNHTV